MISNYDKTNRLRAIAINAIREARIAYGRDDKPWIDDDAARMDVVFQTLFLTELEAIDGSMEHFPLVPKTQPAIDQTISKVADLLGDVTEIVEAGAVSYKVPSKKS